MLTKVCTKCGKEKEATKENFQGHAQGLYGLRPDCKECCSARKKGYVKSHPGYRNEYLRQYRQDNEEKVKEGKRQYLENNRAKVNEHFKQLRTTEPYQERMREYVKSRQHEISQKRKAWEKENKVKLTMYGQKRKAQKKQLLSSLTEAQWEYIKTEFNHKCAYCGMGGDLAQEHFIPLSKGGEYTVNNIIPSCRHCNSSKKNRDFFEWYPKYNKYSKRREQKLLKHLGYDNANTQQLALTV